MSAVVCKAPLWKESVLNVYFFNEEERMRYRGVPLQSKTVMEIVKEGWDFEGLKNGEHVPSFNQVFRARDAHIRVQFKSEPTYLSGSWTRLGAEAKSVKDLTKPTMVLDLKDCKEDYYLKSTILSVFGHALGLGHEHQHPDYLKIMKEFIDVEATMYCFGLNSRQEYQEQYGEMVRGLQKTKYDPNSIMHHPTIVRMLKREYQHLRKPDDVDTDSETTGLHHSKKQMLKEFLRHINFVPGEPSEADKMTLAKAYKGIQSALPLGMKYFNLIKYTDDNGKEQYYRLIDEVFPKWKEFGQQIGITESDLIGIEVDSYDEEECWEKVMQRWLDGQGMNKYPYFWDGVYKLLMDTSCGEIIDDLKIAVTNAVAIQ